MGKYFETALAKWTAKNFNEDGTPRFPNPDVANIGRHALCSKCGVDFPLSQHLSEGMAPLCKDCRPRRFPTADNRERRRFSLSMTKVDCVGGHKVDLPTDLVEQKRERYGQEAIFFCHTHMEGNHHGKPPQA